jgi:hypothetical protein
MRLPCRAADTFINFEAPPPIPAGALAAGTLKQTTLATCAPADTLLPEDFRYEVRTSELSSCGCACMFMHTLVCGWVGGWGSVCCELACYGWAKGYAHAAL